MENYKIIASDLDGTLLNNNAEVSAENLAAIDRVLQKGVVFVPCTGRTYSEIPKNILAIPSCRYVIHSNGAVVYDRETGHRIQKCISGKDARTAIDIFTSYDVHITYRKGGECFVDARYQNEESFEKYNVIEAHQVVIRDFAVLLSEFDSHLQKVEDVEVFSIFFRKYEDKIRCRERIEQTGTMKAVEVSEYNLEIMNIEAGKGNALYSLADMLGVPREATIGVGDSDNDSSLISAAGLGLAVSNGCEALLKIADEKICSNEEHIVDYIEKQYL